MKPTIIALAMASMATPASAADWHFVTGTGFMRDYVDRASIRREGATATAWVYTVYARTMASNGTGPDSYRTLKKVNCANATSQALQTLYFRGAISEGEAGLEEVQSFTQGSIGSVLIEWICSAAPAVSGVADPYADAKQTFLKAEAEGEADWDF